MDNRKPYNPPKNQRLEPELYHQAGYITFITIRAYLNQKPFVTESLNQMIIDILCAEQARMNCTIYTFCLMPDHLHYLISPKQGGYSVLEFTDQFKGKTTNRSWKHGWEGKLWQPRYYDHIVRAEEDLHAIAEYILNNPVRHELVDSYDDWNWCGHLNALP
jgi:REP element-mobilizing transposase RayT